MSTNSSDNVSNSSPKQKNNSPDKNETEARNSFAPIVCTACEQSFATATMFVKHADCCGDSECGQKYCETHSIDAVRIRARSSISSLLNKSSGAARCFCGESFDTQHELILHKDLFHFDGTLYECTVCQSQFTSLERCQKHQQESQHRPAAQKKRKRSSSSSSVGANSQPSLMCQTCGNSFKSAQGLHRHKMRVHRGRIYTCPHCAFTSPYALTLVNHGKELHQQRLNANDHIIYLGDKSNSTTQQQQPQQSSSSSHTSNVQTRNIV